MAGCDGSQAVSPLRPGDCGSLRARALAGTRPLRVDDNRLEIDNNAAERLLRGIAVGRKNRLFVGFDRGGHRVASIYSLVETAKLNCVDLEAWLTNTISRIADHPARRVAELLPWNYRPA